MNCEEVNERLYEYLDDALPANVQTAAREHLEQCEVCRRALEREKVIAQSIESSLELATARLSISSELRRRIVNAARPTPSPRGISYLIWQWFTFKSVRFAGAAALLISLLLIVSLHNHHPAANSRPIVGPNKNQETYVIDVPFHTETHLLQQHNGNVVDAIASSAAVGYAVFFEPKQ